MFEVIPIRAFADNYIWLLRQGKTAAVVDPGDARPVLEVLARDRVELVAILITHHHADHQGGIADLLVHHRAEVFGPASENIVGVDRPLSGGEIVRVAACAIDFQVIPVPGHTRGHIAYYGAGCVFCGDTLFAGGCGRVFEGTPAQMAASLGRLAELPAETLVYCAHEYTEANLRFALAVEPNNALLKQRVLDAAAMRAKGLPTVPSTIAVERATNPFLRCDQPQVIAAARSWQESATDPVSVFAALRDWKNRF